MVVWKEISDHNELYVYMNGQLIYKRWLKTGQSKVFTRPSPPLRVYKSAKREAEIRRDRIDVILKDDFYTYDEVFKDLAK